MIRKKVGLDVVLMRTVVGLRLLRIYFGIKREIGPVIASLILLKLPIDGTL